jgi:hypothetical protein
MNEYERMRTVATNVKKVLGLSDIEWWDLDVDEADCMNEQLFAEYLMEAGMLPEYYEIKDSHFNKDCIMWVAVYNGVTVFPWQEQTKPAYFVVSGEKK